MLSILVISILQFLYLYIFTFKLYQYNHDTLSNLATVLMEFLKGICKCSSILTSSYTKWDTKFWCIPAAHFLRISSIESRAAEPARDEKIFQWRRLCNVVESLRRTSPFLCRESNRFRKTTDRLKLFLWRFRDTLLQRIWMRRLMLTKC